MIILYIVAYPEKDMPRGHCWTFDNSLRKDGGTRWLGLGPQHMLSRHEILASALKSRGKSKADIPTYNLRTELADTGRPLT